MEIPGENRNKVLASSQKFNYNRFYPLIEAHMAKEAIKPICRILKGKIETAEINQKLRLTHT